MSFALSLAIAFIIDGIFGDPYSLPHPVVYMGKLISFSEKLFCRIFSSSKKGRLAAGCCIWIVTASISFLIPFFILSIAGKINYILEFIIQTFWIYQILAAKCLYTESMKVFYALESNDIEKARKLLSYLVGRDTQNLDEQEIIKAVVETVAENTTDGVVAPLFYLAVGGVPAGFLYKAVNTMDSMLGYKNEKYIYLGRCAAYMDDIFNFIPSRISALLMIAAAFLTGLDGKSAFRIFIRDRKNHLSPNSAQTESVAAGALNIQLGGTHDYFGKAVEKPFIGDNIRNAEYNDIRKVNALMYISSAIAFLLEICLLMLI